uniref:Uncharacterized protein n=1 Tax=Anguilla anguilla TaxID=7936 RepID=A0A0E9PZ87_ANGAN
MSDTSGQGSPPKNIRWDTQVVCMQMLFYVSYTNHGGR